MKLLALEINGTPVPVPAGVDKTTNIRLETILSGGVEIIIMLGIVLTTLFLIIAGIQWITSGGSKEEVQKAKGRITYAIVGLIVMFLAFLIVGMVGQVFGTDLIFLPKFHPGQ